MTKLSIPVSLLPDYRAWHTHPSSRNLATYCQMTGDIVTGVVLFEVSYWHKPGDRSGQPRLRCVHNGQLWLARSYAEWRAQYSIGRKPVDRARELLSSSGLVEVAVHQFRGAPTLHWRILWPGFLDAWGRWMTGERELLRQVDVSGPDTDDGEQMTSSRAAITELSDSAFTCPSAAARELVPRPATATPAEVARQQAAAWQQQHEGNDQSTLFNFTCVDQNNHYGLQCEKPHQNGTQHEAQESGKEAEQGDFGKWLASILPSCPYKRNDDNRIRWIQHQARLAGKELHT